jgi:hypothetical protein
MSRMLEPILASGMEGGNKGRINREGKNMVLYITDKTSQYP